MKLRIIFITIFNTIVFLLFSCIKRDNPWDPYNGCTPEEIDNYRNFYITSIDSSLKVLYSYNIWLQNIKDTLYVLKSNNEKILQENKKTSDSIAKILNYNSVIEDLNESQECENKTEKKQISPLHFFHIYPFNKNLKLIEESIETTISYNESLIIASVNVCKGKNVLSDFYIDSVRNIHALLRNDFNTLKEQIEKNNIEVNDSNLYIDSLNAELAKEDSTIYAYNSQISFCKMSRLSDPAKIKEALRKLEGGDSLALDSGVIELGEFFISRKGTPDKKITIIGSPVGRTTIRSPNTVIEDSRNIEFIKITFYNPEGEEGVKIHNNSFQVVFNSCSFIDSKKYGCTVENSMVFFSDCKIEHNGIEVEDSLLITQRAGLRVVNCNNIMIKNSLIADNKGFGIDVLSSNVDIINCTIANNSLDGIRYIGPSYTGSLRVSRTIIAFNKHYGIYREKQVTTRDVFIEITDRFFENSLGSLFADDINLTNNEQNIIVMDPMFVEPEKGDYRIKPESPLYESGIGYHY